MQIVTVQGTPTEINSDSNGPGVVFFVQCRPVPEMIGPIRIDSTTNLAARMNALMAANAFPLYLVGVVASDNPTEAEKQIKEKFKADRMHADWYRPSIELQHFIASVSKKGAASVIATSPAPLASPSATAEDARTIEQIASFLGTSVPTIRRMVRAGSIPYFRVGKRYLFWPKEVLEAIKMGRGGW